MGNAAKRGTTSSQRSTFLGGFHMSAIVLEKLVSVSSSKASEGCTPLHALGRRMSLATEARGCSDLRGNKLYRFDIEYFLPQALQL